MPTLDRLNRDAAFHITRPLPTRVLRPHRAAPAAVGAAGSRTVAGAWALH